ncbi:hypothetical protein QMK33_22875 [Hymenobacter sp. H14-R3]|uniref:hypothetical protein n=1 Tax=Hymenobacter sp. H14-R3 TaxID=3046308 RepID=UPI0024BA4086|nr:hypothetical protein [Hymenobacter sp. H14-R3]MDJ0367996.1 hypothetical protein [Hymenobacter sp. H14-R3]
MYFSFINSIKTSTLAARNTLIFLSSLLILSQCKKDDASPQLPPETTTGAGIFGCKVDNQVFVPQDGRGKPGLYATEYLNLGAGRGGGYFLNLGVVDWQVVNSIGINTDSLALETGKTYQFKSGKGSAQANVIYGNSPYQKLDTDPGQLLITRCDLTQRILSGRFDFVATDKSTGKQIHISDGRFDIKF